jgi:hypothetical protein
VISGAWAYLKLLGTILVALLAAYELFLAVQRDPKDRVLLFEGLAYVTFFLGMLIVKMAGGSTFVIALWLVLFFGSIILAAYFALINWLGRRKKAI